MRKKPDISLKLSGSGFVKSVIMRVLAIFIIVSIIIVTAAFFSFTSEIRRSVLLDRSKQLVTIEQTISERMEEITSIAYNIGNDPVFYHGTVENASVAGLEISKMLQRYLVGNNFIENLAYCRMSEPDTIYVSTGERSLSEFYTTKFGMSKAEAKEIIDKLQQETHNSVKVMGSGSNAYFSYIYPLPQLSVKPQAYVMMMISIKEVQPLFDTLLLNSNCHIAVFDADDNQLFESKHSGDDIDMSEFLKSGKAETEYKSSSGQKYVLQKVVSTANNWTYVSVVPHNDTLTGLANKQLALIIFILLLLVAAIIVMLASIITQYEPIRKLANQVASNEADSKGVVVDERALLKNTIATLKDDSEQKQKYEAAFYEAEAASKAKSAFLSSMSHDIRTPMNAIIGMTAIARKHINDSEYVDECLKKVQVSSEYLLDIINNVLDMSRIESGRIPIAEEPLLIPALIDSVVSLMTSSVEVKAQSLEVDIGELKQTAVIGDSIHLVQVFVNILSNAIKFTPEGGRITLKVRQTESQDELRGYYVFSFSDTGIGIPPEFIEQVFDTFSRANEPVTSKTEGTGLGMAIAKKLTELMGGTISCESEVGKGTTFTVAIAMKYAAREEAMSLESASERDPYSNSEEPIVDLSGKRILLVEDNAMNREIAHKIISETGVEVVEANNGKTAVDIFMNNPVGYFDLIFMDIRMPVMNGYEATAKIRSADREDAATVPIFAMTANTFDEDIRQVKDSGMNGHIGKPYNPLTLYKVLTHVFHS